MGSNRSRVVQNSFSDRSLTEAHQFQFKGAKEGAIQTIFVYEYSVIFRVLAQRRIINPNSIIKILKRYHTPYLYFSFPFLPKSKIKPNLIIFATADDFIVCVQNLLIYMSDQPQGTDNYPVINSFLTTIHEHPAVTTQRDHSPSPRQTAQSFTKQVDQWYEAEARALQAKKQKEIIKQTRLRQLEDEFEAQRLKKQKDWEEKFSNIEKNKSKNLMNIQQKFHKFSIRHNKVFTKMQDQHLKELQEHYDSRKAYDITNSKHYRLINSSQHSSTDSRHRSMRDSKTKTLQQEMASTKMNEISQRLEKAKTLSKQRQEEAINKVRNHNIFELYQVQAKAKEQYDDYFKLYASKIIEKMESADLVKDKVDKKLEKQNEERHKAYSEKLKRIQTNLIQLQEQQEQKFDELTKKLQKTPNRDRDSRDQRETSHHRRFLSNLQQLQRQKMSRADQIIQKHQEITLKNRLFKQRKQQLHKNLKVESH